MRVNAQTFSKRFHEAFDVAVEMLGAPEHERRRSHNALLEQLRNHGFGEHRVCPELLGGGKLRVKADVNNVDPIFYFTMYPEDESPERRQLMDIANGRIGYSN